MVKQPFLSTLRCPIRIWHDLNSCDNVFPSSEKSRRRQQYRWYEKGRAMPEFRVSVEYLQILRVS